MSDAKIQAQQAQKHEPSPILDENQNVVATPSFYRENLDEINDTARTLLEKYSGIAPERVIQHVKDVRDRAYAVFPYPCIGMFSFLDLDLPLSPCYNEIVDRVKKGDKFLDLGCCFGQEIRQLAHEGVPHSNIYGSDLSPDFINLGYELFLDRDKLRGVQFIPSDIFDDNAALFHQLGGQIDIVHASNFFHLFDRDTQVQVAKRVVTKLLRDRPGALIVGTQVGGKNPQHYTWEKQGKKLFIHDTATWKEMWEQVGRETGMRFKVEAFEREFLEQEGQQFQGMEDMFRLFFTVRRE
ncbi:hypothetical protein VTN96DRAFT_628 [Rasamsonia emersonii]|uniref:Methyltransferase type 12 domain-containing protein n=1 Tax=Rasamsonia emersonii (strain ATCC 16479 / CBS 393.64 / IMI 116815) TaxID=1408163 RepID=A0A0F4YXB3_RASE3|nr:hypothetical protein T310_3688 [Rasamsonia emersonii CBS 393.64]KKA22253.1 hypothetical protein T310_3688 [Rasamsonia emersonii CBS 393.64]